MARLRSVGQSVVGVIILAAGLFVFALMSTIMLHELIYDNSTLFGHQVLFAILASLAIILIIAGFRLAWNKPHSLGGLFSPTLLRVLAVFYGAFGLLIAYLALEQWDFASAIRGLTWLLTMFGGFALAKAREHAGAT